MDRVFLRYMPLPTTVKGLTVQDSDGDYNVYINARLAYGANLQTLQHEIQHIDNNDFQKQLHIKDIERM
ncbi:MAG TPA: hypothetical protein VN441_05290 [Syntrophomonas sp.]|nr:hypothetical protein [Syntrophomonas sp.]